MSIDWDIEELACRVLGKTEEETEQIINDSEIDELLSEKYNIDFETYCEIVKDLLPFTPKQTAAISGREYYAFVDDNSMIVKIKA